jgi:hypothetical protein
VNRENVVAITNKLNNIFVDADLSSFPTIQSKFQAFPITFAEVADYALTNSVDTDFILTEVNSFQPQIGFNNNLTQFLDGFDFHLDLNIGKSISEGTCAKFGNILATISGIFDMIDTAKATLDEINAFLNDLDPQKLLASLKSKLTLEALREEIRKAIKKIIKKVRKEIDEAVAKIRVQLKDLGCAAKPVIKKMNKQIQEAKKFTLAENIDRFIEKVEEFVTKFVSGFERVSFETLGLLMYKLCQFTELLHEFLHGPSKDLLKAAEVIAVEATVLKSMALENTRKAVKNGRLAQTDETIKKKKDDALKKINEDTDAQLSDPCPTADEVDLLMDLSDDGLGPNIKFSKKVIENREWQKVDLGVWIKLIRLQSLTKETVTVNQGYRPLKGKGATKGSRSKFAHKTPYAIDIDVTDKSREGTAIAASKVGFTGIGMNRSYLHLDLGARRAWISGKSGMESKVPKDEKLTGEDLTRLELVEEIHEADAWRKETYLEKKELLKPKETIVEEVIEDATNIVDKAINKIKTFILRPGDVDAAGNAKNPTAVLSDVEVNTLVDSIPE